MEARLKRNMVIITAIHVVLILALVVHGAISDWLKRRDVEPEMVTIVDLRSMPAPSLQEAAPEPTPAPPEPEPPEPEPEPVEPPPKPAVSKPEPNKIKVNKVRIKRSSEPEPRRQKPQPSQEDIRRQLRSGIPNPNGVKTSEFTFPNYISRMRAVLYQAWIEPGGDDIPVGSVARVRITVQQDGRISAHRMLGSSGYERMDATVLAAVRSVGQLPPLPEQYARNSRDFTIAFELERDTF